jgi:GntR family histidine utilization transcriptional repressor
LSCLHLAGKRHYALEQRRILLDAIPSAGDADFAETPPGNWLLDHVPWQEAEHRIMALSADPKIAQQLAIEMGTACLVVDRRTWLSGNLLTAVRMWYPGDRHALIARFTPKAAPARS